MHCVLRKRLCTTSSVSERGDKDSDKFAIRSCIKYETVQTLFMLTYRYSLRLPVVMDTEEI